MFSDCSFLSKSLTVSEAGAVAVIVRDNDVENAQSMIDMIDDGTGRSVNIAAFFMLGKDGSVLSVCVVYDNVCVSVIVEDSVCLSVCLCRSFVCLYACLSVCFCASVSLSVTLVDSCFSVCLSVYLSITLMDSVMAKHMLKQHLLSNWATL